MVCEKTIFEFLSRCALKSGSILSVLRNKSEFHTQVKDFVIDSTQYLDRYYDDAALNQKNVKLTFATRVAYLLSNCSDIKRCSVCGKPVFKQRLKADVKIQSAKCMRFCSSKCAANDDSVQHAKESTCMRHYGVKHPAQDRDIYNKMEFKCLEKYGVKNASQSDEIKQKKQETLIKNFGVKSYFESDEFKLKNIKRWGVPYISQADSIKQKVVQTRHKNRSFKVSKTEDHFYSMLCYKFGAENIIRQYSDSRYPFKCDFHIAPFDIFIECNFHWTHGQHAFDSTNENDLEVLRRWMAKAHNSNFYKNGIQTWTVRDVNKRQTARTNNLIYFEFWDVEEAKNWLENKVDGEIYGK